jgi:hypothetical protein
VLKALPEILAEASKGKSKHANTIKKYISETRDKSPTAPISFTVAIQKIERLQKRSANE